jgi:hypothetical protein
LNSDVVLEDIIVESVVSTEIICDFDDISIESVVVSTFNLVFFEITDESEMVSFVEGDEEISKIVFVVSTVEFNLEEIDVSVILGLNSVVVFKDIFVESVVSTEIICDFDDISIESVVVVTFNSVFFEVTNVSEII